MQEPSSRATCPRLELCKWEGRPVPCSRNRIIGCVALLGREHTSLYSVDEDNWDQAKGPREAPDGPWLSWAS